MSQTFTISSVLGSQFKIILDKDLLTKLKNSVESTVSFLFSSIYEYQFVIALDNIFVKSSKLVSSSIFNHSLLTHQLASIPSLSILSILTSILTSTL